MDISKSLEVLIRESFEYSSETGVISWKLDRPLYHFKDISSYKIWKGKFSGKVTGCVQLASGNRYYKTIRIAGKLFLAHRLAWFLYYGKWPSSHIDHMNGDSLDNCILNLREVSSSDNGKNANRKKNNTSGVNGVYFHKQNLNWVAEAHWTEDGLTKKKSLGSFKEIEDAAKARSAWEQENGFTERHGK